MGTTGCSTRVAFRVDASNRIGTGHLMRCLTLAEALRARGASVTFICRAHSGHLMELLRQRGIDVNALPAPEHPTQETGLGHYAAWLGTSEEEDADRTIAALQDEPPDWLVVDHYALSAIWERRLRRIVRRIMVIDDLANRSHDCDLLLDQNYSLAAEERYKGLVPARCAFMVTPRYALLRPEYVRHRRASPARKEQVERLLIFFGGSDPHDMTGRALQALRQPELDRVAVDVVIGANNPNRETLLSAISARPLTSSHGPRDHLADLMEQADLAIGAGGITTWERMCLGVPSIVISIAENQRPACEALRDAGLVRYLGPHDQVRVSDIADALRECIKNSDRLPELSARMQMIVDGLGTSRLAEYLLPTARESLRLRPAAAEDMLFYFDWANDPEVRRQAIRTQEIPFEQHRAWFTAKLAAGKSHLFVLQAGETPVGQIRFDVAGSVATISYSIDAMFRGRGWARQLVSLGVQRLRNLPLRFRAEVKQSNTPSNAVFLGLGFRECTSASNASRGLRTYVLDPIGLETDLAADRR